jgi:NAD kinase
MQNRSSPPIVAFEKGTLGFLCMYKLSDQKTIMSGLVDCLQSHKDIIVE